MRTFWLEEIEGMESLNYLDFPRRGKNFLLFAFKNTINKSFCKLDLDKKTENFFPLWKERRINPYLNW